MRHYASILLGSVASLALVGGMAAPASAAPASTYICNADCSNISFTVADKTFGDFLCNTGGPNGPADCTGVGITPLIQVVNGVTEYGFKISLSLTSTGSDADLSLDYTVNVTDPNFLLHDALLRMTTSATSDCSLGTDCAQITENLFGDSGPDGSLYVTGANPSNSIILPYDTATIQAEKDVFVLAATHITNISEIFQFYSQICVGGGEGCVQVPEPASIALVGAGLLGLSFIRRRKGKSA